MQLEVLYDTLGIGSEALVSEKLACLKKWFQEKLSRDLEYGGSEEEQLAHYEDKIQKYHDAALPYMKQGIGQLASNGFDQVINTLQPAHELLNLPNSDGMTPLHLAAVAGHEHVTQVLLALGANPDALNKQQQSPLFSALFIPAAHTQDKKIRENKEKVFRLLHQAAPALLNQQDVHGDTVMHKMALHGFLPLIKSVWKENPRMFLIKNNHGHFPIHTALLNGQYEAMVFLLSIPELITLHDDKNRQAIHYAAMYGGTRAIQACLDAGCSLEVLDSLGKTPVLLAAEAGNLEGVQALLDCGARIDTPEQLFFYAKSSNNGELISWLDSNYPLNKSTYNFNGR